MIDEYIVLDVETTGLQPQKDKILEIGAAKVQRGKVCTTYQTLINTGSPVPERIQELTGITDAMRKSGRKIKEVMEEFVLFCGDLPILGHNVSFDYSFLKQTAAECGLPFEKEALDTLKIARKVLPELPSRTLEALCVHYELHPNRAHRALDDALSTHELLWEMWHMFKETAPEAFTLTRLTYTAKKQSPITKSQKGYLNDLVKYHKIELETQVEELTKSEASRLIDKIILQYGKIQR